MSASSETAAGATTLAIAGMTCPACVNAVTRALSRVPGVTQVAVDLAAGQARVDGTASAEALHTAVEAAGYEVTPAAVGQVEGAARGRGGCC